MRTIISYFLIACLLSSSFFAEAQFYNKGTLIIDTSGSLQTTQSRLERTASLVNNGLLSCNGQLTNNTAINGLGKVVMKDGGFFSAGLDGTGTIQSLELNSAGDVYLSGAQGITDVLTLTHGRMIINPTGSLRLASTAARTARVAPVLAGSISGPISVERYIPAGRFWRLISAPVSSSNTIRQSWQNNGVYTAGKGTFIKGPGGANGLDTGTTATLMTYNTTTQQMVAVNNTNVPISNATTSAANRGYFAFITGDRNPLNHTAPNTNATTLASTGTLQTGNQVFAASFTGGNRTLVGNPYPSPVDFGKLIRINIKKRFYAWDADLNTVGGYVLIDDVDDNGIYTVTPSTSNLTNIIQPGQAIMVETGVFGTASVTFTEASKTTGSSSAPFRQNPPQVVACTVNLYRNNANERLMIDGAAVYYSHDGNNQTDSWDAGKMMNPDENIAISRGDQFLSLERRNMPAAMDEVPLYLNHLCEGVYQFHIRFQGVASNLSAVLIDDEAKTITPLSLQEDNIVSFKIDTNTKPSNRFRIRYQPLAALQIVSKQSGIATAIENESNASVYPNPSDGKMLSLTLNCKAGNYHMAIVDETGRQVFVKQIEHGGGHITYPVALQTRLSSGLYHIQLTGSAEKKNISLVVK